MEIFGVINIYLNGGKVQILIPILISTIAGLSTVIGGLVVFLKIKPKQIDKFITFCLSFSLSVMICVSITDLIPFPSRVVVERLGIILGAIILIVVFSLGVFIVTIVNEKLEKISHQSSNLYKIGVLSMIALMLHNFPEGIATFMSAYQDINLGINLGFAIMMHNIPEGISIAVPIYYSTGSKKKALKTTFISGLAEPLGAIIAFIFLSKYINELTIALILILVAGIMITLAINKLLPAALEYNKDRYIYLGMIAGAIIMIINHFFL